MVSEHCPICTRRTDRSIPARMAPFIAARVGAGARDVRSYLCESCEHVFFSPLLTNAELELLYRNYRGPEYNAQRILFEPEYAETISLREGTDADFTYKRKEYYDQFFGEIRSFKGKVADFGGGDGYFSRYALPDATITIVEEDFERNGGDLNYLLSQSDFLMCQHVFEHMSTPSATLDLLQRPLRIGAICYIELPLQYRGKLSEAFCDLEKMALRGEDLPWDPLVTLHEHLNHFSKKSLSTMLRVSGFTPIEFHHSSSDIFGALAVKV